MVSLRLDRRPLVNADGIADLKLLSLETVVKRVKSKGNGPAKSKSKKFVPVNVHEVEMMEWKFEMPCATAPEPFPYSIMTGFVISPDPIEVQNEGRGASVENPIYSKIVTLIMNLGFLDSIQKIDQLPAIGFDDFFGFMEHQLPMDCRAKMYKSEGFWRMDVQSISRVSDLKFRENKPDRQFVGS